MGMFFISVIEEFDNKSNILRVYDYSISELNTIPVKMGFNSNKYEHVLDYVDVDVLIPSEDLTDFIFRYSRGVIVNKLFEDQFDKELFIGKSFADVFPDLKKYFYPLFKKLMDNGETQTIKLIFYKDTSIFGIFNCDIQYDNGELFLIYDDCTNHYYMELYSKSSFFIHDLDSDSYSWSNSLEELFEQPIPLNSDIHEILHNLILPEDWDKFKSLEKNLNLNNPVKEITCQIKTVEGNIKHLHMILKPIGIDTKVHKCLYIFKDFSDYKLQDYNLRRFYDALQDVEKSAEISVHYKTADGKYHWTPEVYEIIEREPEDDDENRNIIYELAPEEEQKNFDEALANLKPNEFLGNHIFPITTAKGNIKYLQVDVHAIYDKNGNFVQRNEYAMDVTNTVKYEEDLIRADHEKIVLIKESHHRFKNDLQLITNFINLEQRFHKDDPQKIMELTKKRIHSLALIHERIYNEYDMKSINVSVFLNDFDKSLFDLAMSDVEFINEIDSDFTLTSKFMTPITLIINELTTNSFKYAWDDEFEGEMLVTKSFKQYKKDDKDYCEFIYKDNGKGLNDGFDIEDSDTLGWKLIMALSSQIDADYELVNDNGLIFKLTFEINSN